MKSDAWKQIEVILAVHKEFPEELIEQLEASERLKLAKQIVKQAGGWYYLDRWSDNYSMKLQGLYRLGSQEGLEVHRLVGLLAFSITYLSEKNGGRYSPPGTPRYHFVG